MIRFRKYLTLLNSNIAKSRGQLCAFARFVARRDIWWAQTASNEATGKLVLENTEVCKRRGGIRSQTVDVHAEDLRNFGADEERDVC